MRRLKVRLDEGLVHGVHCLGNLLDDELRLLPRAVDVAEDPLHEVEVNATRDRHTQVEQRAEAFGEGVDPLHDDHPGRGRWDGAPTHALALLEAVHGHLRRAALFQRP